MKIKTTRGRPLASGLKCSCNKRTCTVCYARHAKREQRKRKAAA